MKLQEIRGVCNTNFSHKRNEEICEQLKYTVDIDGDLIGTVYSKFMNYNPNQNPIQIIDSVLNGEDSNNSGLIYKGWCNTWPFGMPTDKTYPRFLAICRGEKRVDKSLDEALDNIKKQSKKMVKDCKEKYKTVILLTDIWSLAIFKKYEKIFLEHALRDGIWYIFLLVTEYGYTQIPFLPNDRHMLDSCRGEKIEDDLSMDDIYRYLKDYPFEYHFSTTLDKYGNTEYIFNVEYMTWEKHSFREHCGGHISRRLLNALVKKLCWIIDSKENSISFYNSKDNFFKLKIFGKTVEWDFIPEYEEKNIKELPVAIRKFIEACEKHKE